MATNPMFGTKQVSNNATAPSNPLNSPDKRYFRNRNKFDFSRKFYGSFRYADIMPFECVRGVEGDILSFGSRHQIRSEAFKSIIQSPLHLKKTYTQVDMKCILPINWDKIYKVPVHGDDVPEDCYTSVKSFYFLISNFIQKQLNVVFQTTKDNYTPFHLHLILRSLCLFESVYSNGSLLSYLGCHTSPLYEDNHHNGNFGWYDMQGDYGTAENLDYWLDEIYHLLLDSKVVFRFPDTPEESFIPNNLSELRDCIERYRLDFDAGLDFYVSDPSLTRNAFSSIASSLNTTVNYPVGQDDNLVYIDLAPLHAYQISCATFFSRDSVDNIYSAEHYRELLRFYLKKASMLTEFSYNGRSVEFDYCSAYYFKRFCNDGFGYDVNSSFKNQPIGYAFAYLSTIFNINKSLRFGDYFTGSKIEPLAVGDVTASVNNNAVNAIDITVSLLKARFLNAVNRARNSYKSFIEDVMDGVAPPRDDEPRWLATVTSRVSGFEVENTSNINQGNIVTLLKSSDSKYVYELEVGTPCIVLGLLTFEMPRVYSKSVDRHFYHRDRYDFFNKFMQYSGDQAIKNNELNAAYKGNLDNGTNYSYTPRHMEYKQRFPIAVGAYVNELKSFLFITDNNSFTQPNPYESTPHINEFNIRSRNIEFDRFYPSLTGISLASYYHFFIEFENICVAHRKMEKNPTIL